MKLKKRKAKVLIQIFNNINTLRGGWKVSNISFGQLTYLCFCCLEKKKLTSA